MLKLGLGVHPDRVGLAHLSPQPTASLAWKPLALLPPDGSVAKMANAVKDEGGHTSHERNKATSCGGKGVGEGVEPTAAGAEPVHDVTKSIDLLWVGDRRPERHLVDANLTIGLDRARRSAGVLRMEPAIISTMDRESRSSHECRGSLAWRRRAEPPVETHHEAGPAGSSCLVPSILGNVVELTNGRRVGAGTEVAITPAADPPHRGQGTGR